MAKPHLADFWQQYGMSPHNAALVAYQPETGRVHTVPDRKKVCIYGAGYGKQEAPLEDPDWFVWALNLVPPLDRLGRLRADVWWDIHQREAQTADDLRWIAACPFGIYLPPDLQDASPNAIAFPLERLEERYGISYWACTFAYQIALAMDIGATDIGLYGVELAYGSNRERTVEWANVAYWIGRATESGVRIHTPTTTTLRNHPGRYGFEYRQELEAVKEYTDGMLLAAHRITEGMGG